MKQHGPNDSDHEKSLIDLYLEEQRSLTAVEKFSRFQSSFVGDRSRPSYTDLIPIRPPGRGEQYGFEVDLDSCSGCKACVTACHSLNGLDEGESWRSTGLLHGYKGGSSWQQTITTACHHCLEPACLHGCPVLAYEKDPATGIVRHLDDQCIGCTYCVMKCPYEVPKYSASRGIVRKCDMCASRLSASEAPGCVQACPTSAIRIRLVDIAASSTLAPLLPTAPSSNITRPTTEFRSRNPMPADAFTDTHKVQRPEPAHWPLVFMLVLTQASVGLLTTATFFGSQTHVITDIWSTVLGVAGIVVGVFHLGRPLHAWKSFLGFKRSWLSREVVAFALYLTASSMVAGADLMGIRLGSVRIMAVALGWAGVFSSIMVYVDTRRDFWGWRYSLTQFAGATALLGSAAALCLLPTLPSAAPLASALQLTVILLASLKLAGEWAFIISASRSGFESLRWSARLLTRDLALEVALRFIAGLVGLLVLSISILEGPSHRFALTLLAAMLLGAGETMERLLFFRAVAPARMPGRSTFGLK